MIEDLLASHGFEFPVERAVFAAVLHRLMVSGSDRACEKWLGDYAVSDVDGLALHHLYRAMAWLGEELSSEQQAGATPFAPRTVKDLAEEQLFAHRRDLFSELSVVFLDTTSLRFTGAGGETLGERGYIEGPPPRTDTLIRTVVLADTRPFTPLCVRRSGGEETQLWVKECKVEGQRHIVCRNEAEAERDAADRRAIIEALVGNSACRRYLRTTSDARAFEIRSWQAGAAHGSPAPRP